MEEIGKVNLGEFEDTRDLFDYALSRGLLEGFNASSQEY